MQRCLSSLPGAELCNFASLHAVQGAWVTEKAFRLRTISAGLSSEDRGLNTAAAAPVITVLKSASLLNATLVCHFSLAQKHLDAVQGAWVTEKVFRPRPVSAALISERIESVDTATGAAVVVALKQAGLLNATDFLIEDPRYCSCSLCAYAAGMDCHAWLKYPLPFRAVPMIGKFMSENMED